MKIENWKLEVRSRKLDRSRNLWTMDHGPWTLLSIILILAFTLPAHAQSDERKLIRDGNKLYKEKKFSDAEVQYRKSLGVNKNSIPGNYNLGNAYYKQGKFDEASQQYQSALSGSNLNDDQKAKALHNIGNSLLESRKYPESIEAFKNSLKLNPKDNDTRYNLAYAQSMLQQQQQQQQKEGKSDKNKKQDSKDQKNKEQQNKEKQDQAKNQQNKDQQKQDQAQDKQAGQKKNISKEDAEKILQALNNDEKNTQKKMVKKEGTRIQIEKEW